jgi:hypothetical protein
MTYSHLHPKTLEKMGLSDEDRIEWMKLHRWLGYPHANIALERLEELLAHPRVDRMPNLLLLGRTNNGKTTVAKEFVRRHPPDENIGGDYIYLPVLYIECPGTPTEAGIYNEIFKTLYGSTITGSIEQKRDRVANLLKQIQTKVLIIDELHNLSAVGAIKMNQVLNGLKYLGNILQLSLVGCGDARLPRMIRTDDQIENRFQPVVLPHWKFNKEFRQLLASYQRILPLKKESRLNDKQIALKLYAMSEGAIGELSRLLNLAAAYAIKSGDEEVTLKGLESCGYVAPNARKEELAGI